AEVAFVLRNIGAMDAEDIDGDNVDLRFEDAEGRDTGCDVSIVEYAEKAADLLEQHERIVGDLRADRDSWAEQAEQRLADWDEMRKERDAALAEVAGLRSLLNSLLCYVERDINRMRSDRDKSDNKEIYDRSISLAMERLKAAQNAVFTTEPGCDTAVELAAQTTQALREEVERGNRITVAMALDISAVGEALGIPGEEQEGGTGEFIDLIRELQKEAAALRARVVVVPDAANDRRKSAHYCRGWNACLDELARLNGLTVSEGLLRRLCEPLLSHADYVVARNELRALLSEQDGGKP
ncbi:hypothetical protein ACRZYO_005435, partial [Pseudomonas aeruginosa]